MSFAPPLYFAKFAFSEIIRFAETPPPGPDVLRRAAVSVNAVIIRYSTGLFCCSSMDYLQACVRAALCAIRTAVQFLLARQLRLLCLVW